jgi:hypothetical protein
MASQQWPSWTDSVWYELAHTGPEEDDSPPEGGDDDYPDDEREVDIPF